MIDTIRLHIPQGEFSVSERHGLTVQPAALRQNESGELEPEIELDLFNGVRGACAYYENERFTVRIDLRGFSVLYSVPRLLTGCNVYSVGHGGLVGSLALIEQSLSEIGVSLDMPGATISRLDCFRNIHADMPFIDYRPVFELASAQRQDKRQYGTTYLWHNTQHELCCYDKRHELIQTGKVIPEGLPDNIIRVEQRWLNARKIRKSLPVSKAEDLKSRDRYERLKAVYADRVRSTLFRWDPAQLDINSLVEGTVRIADMSDSTSEIFENGFVDLFVRSGGSEETFREALRLSYSQRLDNKDSVNQAVYRAVKKFREARERLILADSKNRDLYSELYTKFNEAV